jgi:hypothetical protein
VVEEAIDEDEVVPFRIVHFVAGDINRSELASEPAARILDVTLIDVETQI